MLCPFTCSRASLISPCLMSLLMKKAAAAPCPIKEPSQAMWVKKKREPAFVGHLLPAQTAPQACSPRVCCTSPADEQGGFRQGHHNVRPVSSGCPHSTSHSQYPTEHRQSTLLLPAAPAHHVRGQGSPGSRCFRDAALIPHAHRQLASPRSP